MLWSATAIVSVEEIIDGFAADDYENAISVVEGIQLTGDKLELFPLRGRHVPEVKHLGAMGLHEVFYKVWRIIYEVREAQVNILLVVDGRRNLDEVLLQTLFRRRK